MSHTGLPLSPASDGGASAMLILYTCSVFVAATARLQSTRSGSFISNQAARLALCRTGQTGTHHI